MHAPPEMCLRGAVLALCCTAAGEYGASPAAGPPGSPLPWDLPETGPLLPWGVPPGSAQERQEGVRGPLAGAGAPRAARGAGGPLRGRRPAPGPEQLQVPWGHEGRTVLELAGAGRGGRRGRDSAWPRTRGGAGTSRWCCRASPPVTAGPGPATSSARRPGPGQPHPARGRPVGAPRRLPLVRGCPTAAAAGRGDRGLRPLGQRAAGAPGPAGCEVKRCLGSPEAEERPPRAEAASANRTVQAV
ncbi:unnamed protein product, partial [Natator depressus]